MKIVLVSIQLFIILTSAYTQDSSICFGVMNVNAEKMNVLYLGVDNPIGVSSCGISSRDLGVRITNGKLLKYDSGKYIIQPDSIGICNVFVSISGKKETKFMFRVKGLPPPILFGLTTDNEEFSLANANIYQIRSLDKLIPQFHSFDFYFKTSLVGNYKITITRSTGESNTFILDKFILPQNITEIIKTLDYNDIVLIEGVSIKIEANNIIHDKIIALPACFLKSSK